MDKLTLLPQKFKMIGLMIFLPAFLLSLATLYNEFTFDFLTMDLRGTQNFDFDSDFLFNLKYQNFTDEVGIILTIVGLLFIAFSKEKHEDEMINYIRLKALMWSVLWNSLIVIFCVAVFYNSLFLNVLLYNLCTTLILFIIKFNFDLFKLKRKAE